MLLTILAKLVGTILGLLVGAVRPGADYTTAAVLGIAPIWLEVVATKLTANEPSLEARPVWRRFDAAVDFTSFVLAPPLWFARRALNPSVGLSVLAEGLVLSGLLLFVFCGGLRLRRFLRVGLVDGQFFEGLPVTYTGYLWVVLVFFLRRDVVWPVLVLLGLASSAMVWRRIRIRRTQVDHDPA